MSSIPQLEPLRALHTQLDQCHAQPTAVARELRRTAWMDVATGKSAPDHDAALGPMLATACTSLAGALAAAELHISAMWSPLLAAAGAGASTQAHEPDAAFSQVADAILHVREVHARCASTMPSDTPKTPASGATTPLDSPVPSSPAELQLPLAGAQELVQAACSALPAFARHDLQRKLDAHELRAAQSRSMTVDASLQLLASLPSAAPKARAALDAARKLQQAGAMPTAALADFSQWWQDARAAMVSRVVAEPFAASVNATEPEHAEELAALLRKLAQGERAVAASLFVGQAAAAAAEPAQASARSGMSVWRAGLPDLLRECSSAMRDWALQFRSEDVLLNVLTALHNGLAMHLDDPSDPVLAACRACVNEELIRPLQTRLVLRLDTQLPVLCPSPARPPEQTWPAAAATVPALEMPVLAVLLPLAARVKPALASNDEAMLDMLHSLAAYAAAGIQQYAQACVQPEQLAAGSAASLHAAWEQLHSALFVCRHASAALTQLQPLLEGMDLADVEALPAMDNAHLAATSAMPVDAGSDATLWAALQQVVRMVSAAMASQPMAVLTPSFWLHASESSWQRSQHSRQRHPLLPLAVAHATARLAVQRSAAGFMLEQAVPGMAFTGSTVTSARTGIKPDGTKLVQAGQVCLRACEAYLTPDAALQLLMGACQDGVRVALESAAAAPDVSAACAMLSAWVRQSSAKSHTSTE